MAGSAWWNTTPNFGVYTRAAGGYLSVDEWARVATDAGGRIDTMVWPFPGAQLPWRAAARNEYHLLLRVFPAGRAPRERRARRCDVRAGSSRAPEGDGGRGDVGRALAKFDDASLDVVMCTSVLEHLWEPRETLREFPGLLAPGGACLVNVPMSLGERALELSAFRLGLSPTDSIDDHKTYYDPRDLWPCSCASFFGRSESAASGKSSD